MPTKQATNAANPHKETHEVQINQVCGGTWRLPHVLLRVPACAEVRTAVLRYIVCCSKKQTHR